MPETGGIAAKRHKKAERARFFIFGNGIKLRWFMKSKRIEDRRGRVRGPDGLAPVRLRALELLAAVGPVKIPARAVCAITKQCRGRMSVVAV
jgi:hypothetical protein